MNSVAYSLDRGLPASVDAETSILGCIIMDNFCYLQCSALLTPDDFSMDSNRRIYQRMMDLQDAGSPIDFFTLKDALERNKELEIVGGAAYLSSLTDLQPQRSNISHYVAIIRDKSLLRKIVNMGNLAISDAMDQTTPAADVLENVQQSILEMIYRDNRIGVDVKQAGRETLERLASIRSFEGECIGAPTGIQALDVLTTGYRDKEFYVIGARPGAGKTALMCQGVRAAILKGRKPGVFSIEVDRNQIITRMACMESGISVFDTRDPRSLSDSDFNYLREAVANVSSEWDWFLEDGRMNLKKLAAIARMWVSKGCDSIWVDYLGLLASRAPGKSEYDRVTETADRLWELARFVGVPVIALCQLRRGDGSEPTMEELRSSGQIEQNANGIFLLYRPQQEGTDGHKHYTGEDKIIIAKQRSGPAQIFVPVRFNGPVGMFEER